MTSLKRHAVAVLLTASTAFASAQSFTVDLWQGTIPGSLANDKYTEETVKGSDGLDRVRRVTNPTLTAYLPADTLAEHRAIVVCPGGGYAHLAIDSEGHAVARRLAENGVAAFVLKYRLPSDAIMQSRAFGPLADAQRAIRLVRQNAREWHVDPQQVGIMGFSAGGNLAANASVHFDHAAYEQKGDTLSARPDFSVLVYPVASTDSTITHAGTCRSLFGGLENAGDLSHFFSAEENVTDQTPPAFLVHASNDRAVNFRNSLRYAEALREHGIEVEMHIYPSGGHGFGLATGQHQGQWFDALLQWLRR